MLVNNKNAGVILSISVLFITSNKFFKLLCITCIHLYLVESSINE